MLDNPEQMLPGALGHPAAGGKRGRRGMPDLRPQDGRAARACRPWHRQPADRPPADAGRCAVGAQPISQPHQLDPGACGSKNLTTWCCCGRMFALDPPMPSRQADDLALGVLDQMCRSVLGAGWQPISISFGYEPPPPSERARLSADVFLPGRIRLGVRRDLDPKRGPRPPQSAVGAGAWRCMPESWSKRWSTRASEAWSRRLRRPSCC